MSQAFGELGERNLGDAVRARQALLANERGLGPPDFCHVVLANSSSGSSSSLLAVGGNNGSSTNLNLGSTGPSPNGTPNLAASSPPSSSAADSASLHHHVPIGLQKSGSDKALRFSGSKNLKRQGTYHYVLGLNTSAPGPVAAYFNSLSSLLQRNEQSSGWFSRNTKWSVAGALFCSWNAFRQEDVYIEMQIPGGVNAFFLDGANQRVPLDQQWWNEIYVSGVLRALRPSTVSIPGLRRLPIFSNRADEQAFLEAVKTVISQGSDLGPDDLCKEATILNNVLVRELLDYFLRYQRMDIATTFFEQLSAVHPEFGILAAYCLLKTDEEARGVSILYDIVKSVPWSQLDYNALVVQAQFLLRKEQADLATKVALSIVERNPVEPRGWLTLSVAWVANEKPHHALRALNSCPMVRPLPDSIPVPGEPSEWRNIRLEFEEDEEDDEVDERLATLPAHDLKGTFKEAYSILVSLYNKLTWPGLLQVRSETFWMEGEDSSKAATLDILDRPPVSANVIYGSTSFMAGATTTQRKYSALDEKGLRRTSLHIVSGDGEFQQIGNADPKRIDEEPSDLLEALSISSRKPSSEPMSPLPINPTSVLPHEFRRTPSQPNDLRRASHSAELQGQQRAGSLDDGMSSNMLLARRDSGENTRMPLGRLNRKNSRIKRDSSLQPVRRSSSDDNMPIVHLHLVQTDGSASKRLSTPWLTELFLCLYEDLRVYLSIFTDEKVPLKSLKFTCSELRLLGDLCLRLGKKLEAKQCYDLCASMPRFSRRAWHGLLQIYLDDEDHEKAVDVLAKLFGPDEVQDVINFPSPLLRGLAIIMQRLGSRKETVNLITNSKTVDTRRQGLLLKALQVVDAMWLAQPK